MKDAIRAKLNEHVKGSYVHAACCPLLLSDSQNCRLGMQCIAIRPLLLAAGVVDVEVVMSKEAPGTGRGFCFVEFYNHSAAAHAKGLLGSENYR